MEAEDTWFVQSGEAKAEGNENLQRQGQILSQECMLKVPKTIYTSCRERNPTRFTYRKKVVYAQSR